MRLVWIGAFVLVFASLAWLVSNRQSGRLVAGTWTSASRVLPDTKLAELQQTTPAYTHRILEVVPEQLRQGFAAKTWKAVELMTLRSLVLWHLAPAFVMPFFIGFLEGRWVRSSQNTLIKMHSPMRFSLALIALGSSPLLALLWITAPVALPANLLVFSLGTIAVVSTRTLIAHAPTQF